MRRKLVTFLASVTAVVMLFALSSGILQASAVPLGDPFVQIQPYEDISVKGILVENEKYVRSLDFYAYSVYEYTYQDDPPVPEYGLYDGSDIDEPLYNCDSDIDEPPYDCDSDIDKPPYNCDYDYDIDKPPYDYDYDIDELPYDYDSDIDELPYDLNLPYDIIPPAAGIPAIITAGPTLNMPQQETFTILQAFEINGFTLDRLESIVISTISEGSEWRSTAPITNREQLGSLWQNLSAIELISTWHNPEMFTEEEITIDFQFTNPNWSVGIQAYGQVAVFGQGPFVFANGMSTRDFIVMFAS